MNPRPSAPGWAKGLAVTMVLGLLAAAGVSVAVAVSALGHEGTMTVTAHRGDHRRAPENTMAAVRDAIAAGADMRRSMSSFRRMAFWW